LLVVRATLLFCLIVAAGCGDDDVSGQEDAGADAAPQETLCPPADHPRVHYLGMDASECVDVELDCTSEQTGFNNACGCGCVDKGDAICPDLFDPAIMWVSHDPAECDGPPPCQLGDTPFDNSCGCGCITH
jgi:hypothetical protein